MKRSSALFLACAFVFAHFVGCASSKTASYHYTQKQIERGDLSFTDRLRVDEYVNAFPQGDFAKPTAGSDIEIKVDFITDVLPPTKSKALAQIAVRSREARKEERARKQGLVFVLDVSGSMSEDNKFLDAKDALIAMISELENGTEFALVTFSTYAKEAISPTIIDKTTHEELKAKVRALEISGGTNIEAGLVLGYKTLASFREAKTSRLLLLTDGNSNVGITDPKELAKKAGVQYIEAARISTIGLGHDVDETMLRSIATAGHGAYYFAESAASLKTLFVKEVSSLMIPIVKNVEVTISTEGATISQIYGYPAPKSPYESVVEVGELNSDDWRIFIVELALDPKSNSPVVKSQVTFDTAAAVKHGAKKARARLEVNEKKKPKLNRTVARNAVVTSNALALLKVSELDKAGSHVEAVDVVDVQLANMELARDWDSSAEFAREFQNLERVKRMLQERAGVEHATAPTTPPSKDPNYKKLAIKGALAIVEKAVAGPWGVLLGLLTFAIE